MGPKVLPHIGSDKVFLTDGGLETYLIYKKNIDLPGFAAFTIVKDEAGKEILRHYYRKYFEVKQLFSITTIVNLYLTVDFSISHQFIHVIHAFN